MAKQPVPLMDNSEFLAELEQIEQSPSATAHISPTIALVGFVLMMVVGAASAALLFHDRLARLLR